MFKMVAVCGVALASVAFVAPAAAQDCGGETGMVCGFVWNDANNNGLQDLGETGLANKLVTLSDGSDTVEAYTDASGFFYFYDVTADTYTLSIETSVIGSTAVASTPNAGSDDAIDSDGTSNGTTSSVTFQTLTNFEKVDYDFGFYTPSAHSSSLGTGTPGYWKNHPEAWPDTIVIGGITYVRDTAIYWLKRVGKDKTTTMFSSLVSAKLNVLMGNESSCIAGTIALADAWMGTYGPVGSNVAASSSAWAEGQSMHTMLDDYNNGRLCAPHRN